MFGLSCFGQEAAKFTDPELKRCVVKIYSSIKDVKVGSTREEFSKLFTSAPGFGRNNTYVYTACPLVHVDVEFETKAKGKESPDDTIKSISRFYLDGVVID